MNQKNTQGLAGVNAGETAIASVGKGHGLKYRGYDIYDLAKHTLALKKSLSLRLTNCLIRSITNSTYLRSKKND